eukprot:CAMPEP_0119012288 /NCGR_PEP_ID=MMETSP1176-20130426/6194_1 /TAXON_ID=265551 /ORGANISM="Synedropsis recta cf, Strain CCMP1620" /LENGTH=402 /DNA_ID=CAMNT_0006965211 /DNA_START=213 /DNA_END=1421 /DNA_ORIENTATION=-
MSEKGGDSFARSAPDRQMRGNIVISESDSVHFGVVGAGRSQKILIFRSSGSLVQEAAEALSIGGWTCDGCSYDNGSDLNSVCAMCGNCRHSNLAMMPINEDAGADVVGDTTAGERGGVVPQPLTKKPSLSSSRSPSMRKLLVKRLSASGMQDADLTVDCLLQARNREQKEKKDDLTTSLARISIADAGGWTCPDCTFVNMDSNYLTCEVCAAEKPPKEDLAMESQSSIQDFLTNSTKDGISNDAFVDPQIQAYMVFEHTAATKEMMTSLMRKSSAVLDAASQRSSEQLSDAEISELRGILDEGQGTLRALKTFYDNEQKDFTAMDELQRTKALEIASEEGMAPHLSERATRPGVQRVSGKVLEWHGQQRMLDDWKMQLDMRKMQIQQLETQQQESLDRLLGK